MCKSRDDHPEHCDTCCTECEACPIFSLEDHARGCSKGLNEPEVRYTYGFLDPDDRFEAGDPSHYDSSNESE